MEQPGGASTDPNDGSLWVYGEFAKPRLSTIPGPGQWGTSLANYALNFPATDTSTNDSTFFSDVPPGSPSFAWIQLAKNLGIAQPTGTPEGNSGIVVPPAAACLAAPLFTPVAQRCRQFNPTVTVTRAEMAYWVVALKWTTLR